MAPPAFRREAGGVDETVPGAELLRRGGIFADYYQTQFAPQERAPAELPIPA